MRFRRGRKSFGLIAVLSCVLTATVAFAAYTGYNYIKGTTEIEGNPFMMVFANADGSDIVNSTISAASAQVQAATASDLTVSDDGTKIDSFTVTITEDAAAVGDAGAIYFFSLRNDGGAPAYISAIDCGDVSLPTAGDGSTTAGLVVQLIIGSTNDVAVGSYTRYDNGDPTVVTYGSTPVEPGAVVPVKLVVYAMESSNGPPVWEAVDANGDYGAEIAFPEIKLTWSAVPSETSGT